jgi:hypothetical protein
MYDTNFLNTVLEKIITVTIDYVENTLEKQFEGIQTEDKQP